MKTLLLFILIGLPRCFVLAQSPQGWEHTRIGISEGLSDNNVFHIFKDSRGFCWIATQNGVNRWDGNEIRTFSYNPSDTNSLSGNWVNFTLEDRKGFLWFGTFGAGLCRFDPRLEKFERFQKPPQPEGTNNDVVTCGIQDSAGILWLGTTSDGLRRFDPVTLQVLDFHAKQEEDAAGVHIRVGPPSAHVNHLLEQDEQILWVGTANGLCRFDKITQTFETFQHNPDNNRSLPHNFILGLHRSPDGDIWVQTPKGLVRFDAKRNDFQLATKMPHIPQNFNLSRIWKDSNGAIWEATNKGARYWYPRTNPFELDWSKRYDAKVFGLKKVRNLLEYGNFLWIASEDGLFRSAIGSHELEQFLPHHFHTLVDNGSFLWAMSKVNGLFRIDASTKTLKQYPIAPDGKGGSNNTGLTATKDVWGRLWLGGYNLFECFSPRTELSSPISTLAGTTLKKPASSILSLFFDNQNRLWAGTLSEGVFVYFFDKNGNISGSQQFRYNPQNLQSISNDIVLAIWQDQTGGLWFGTDGGLNHLSARWNPDDIPLFRRFLKADGLADNKIMSIRDDAAGNIWVAHLSHGLSKISLPSDSIQTFTTAHGLPSPMLYWTSAWKRPDGALLFGSTEGLVVFHPDSLHIKNKAAPPIFFTEILLFNKKIDIGQVDPYLSESPIFTPTLSFSHAQNSLVFRFAALNFIHPEQNCYAYRLDPLDNQWHDLDTRNEVSLSHLRPGYYTLRIKASDNEGVWNEIGASIQFRIRPPWWQTGWAYLCYALLLGVAIWLLLRKQVLIAKQKTWQHFGQALAALDLGTLPLASAPEIIFLKNLYKVLEEHLANENFSIEQLAKELTMSRTQLHRKTIEVTGFSAGQLLQNLRLEHARNLLSVKNMTVAEVAFQCGFSDPNYFSRLFSKTQGMTPTEFVQKIQN